jgi:hypothetical protein
MRQKEEVKKENDCKNQSDILLRIEYLNCFEQVRADRIKEGGRAER